MYEFFKFCFYAISIGVIFFELWSIHNFAYIQTVNGYMDEMKKGKDLKEFPDHGKVALLILGQLIYFVWLIIGFFSSQWLFFLIIFLMGMVPTKWRSADYNFWDSVVSIGLIIFAILNTYHFHL